MTKDISFEMSFAWLVRVTKFLKQLLQTVHIDSSLFLLPPAPQNSTIFNILVVSEFYDETTVEFEENSFISFIIAPCGFKVFLLSGLKKKLFIYIKSLIKVHSSNLLSSFRKLIGLSYLLYHILCLQSIFSLF